MIDELQDKILVQELFVEVWDASKEVPEWRDLFSFDGIILDMEGLDLFFVEEVGFCVDCNGLEFFLEIEDLGGFGVVNTGVELLFCDLVDLWDME